MRPRCEGPVDKEIMSIIDKMNRLGFSTKCSCSGYKIKHKGSSHTDFRGYPYVLFTAPFSKVERLRELLSDLWKIEYIRKHNGEDYWGLTPNVRPEWMTQSKVVDLWSRLSWALTKYDFLYVRKMFDVGLS